MIAQQEERMTFTFKLERPDGTPADPPETRRSVSKWEPGDLLTFGGGRR
jgi:hypothetical protein